MKKYLVEKSQTKYLLFNETNSIRKKPFECNFGSVHKIAGIYFKQNNFEKAFSEYNKALLAFEKIMILKMLLKHITILLMF